MTEKLKLVFGSTENNVRKEETAGYQHFFIFPQCFQKACFSRVLQVWIIWLLNSLPNDKILDQSNLKALADHKINVNEKLYFDLGRVENMIGKGKNPGNLHFLLFPECFQTALIVRVVKSWNCVVKG